MDQAGIQQQPRGSRDASSGGFSAKSVTALGSMIANVGLESRDRFLE